MLVLQLDEVLQRSDVVAKRQLTAGLNARQYSSHVNQTPSQND
jgi:hypothetical protein